MYAGLAEQLLFLGWWLFFKQIILQKVRLNWHSQAIFLI